MNAVESWNALGWISAREREALSAAGFPTPESLLGHLPKRHEDRRRFDGFPFAPSADAVCLRGTVVDTTKRGFGRQGFFEAIVMDGAGGVFGSGKITCRWFNMPFMRNVIATGQELVIYGKVKDAKGRLIMDHPETEVLREGDEGSSLHLGRITPVYRNLSGISQRRLREILHRLLEEIPASAWTHGLDAPIGKPAAVRDAHFPAEADDGLSARRLLAREEFFRLQLRAAWQRKRHHALHGRVLGKRTRLLTEFYRSLPFDLTDAQKRSIHELVSDMRRPHPMNRLLQGDVGAGKTFVAMAAMLLAVDSGCQAVLMAPTQILAEQHFLTFRRWLAPLSVRVRLKTGARDESTHLEIEGASQIIIGTHALLYDGAEMEDAGLVIIDEQHKFGVAQRAGLVRKGVMPDVLVMTATPIPRTLAMTLYGDLDVSVLDGKPAGRGKIVTALRVSPKQADVAKFVTGELAKGRQAYLVYPLVEDSESVTAESATAAFEKWRKRLKGYETGLLHGRMKPEEKEEVMRRFRDGGIHALVATTVIEVGVDVPNASVMLLHHAERFGLAQLHQLRGRIGRGGHTGYCVLITDGKNPGGVEKLRVIERSSDGFEIAEADLELRGPGEVLGTRQSGTGAIVFPEFLTDIEMIREVRELAGKLLDEDPDLAGVHAELRLLVDFSEPPAAV